MSTDNMDDGEDHSRIIAVHEWLHSALYAESAYPSSKWWVHSLCLGKLLDIPGGTAGVDNFAKRLKKNIARPGCCGGAKKINVDDQHGNNVLGLRRRGHGRKINKSDRTVYHEPTLDIAKAGQREQYFSVGHEANAINVQLKIVLHVTGEKGFSSAGERMRRREHWRSALTGGRAAGDRHYRIIDVPKLALQFSTFWETDMIGYEDIDEIPQSVLKEIQREIVGILQYSSVLPLPDDCSLLMRISRRLQGMDEQEELEEECAQPEDQPRQPRKRRRRSRDPPQSVEDDDENQFNEFNRLPMFDYTVLDKEWFEDDKYLEVGRKEIMLEGALNNLPLFLVNQTIRALGADPYLAAEYKEVTDVADRDKRKLTRYSYNFQLLKDKITSKEHKWSPYKLKQGVDLLEYWAKGQELTRTRRVDHKMYEKGDSGNVMTTATAAIVRQIVLSYNVPLSTFPGMLCSYAVLLLGRPLDTDEFFSTRTVRNHIIRLNIIDDYFIGRKIEEVFTGKQT